MAAWSSQGLDTMDTFDLPTFGSNDKLQCSPCQYDGNSNEARGYCHQCEEYLCITCMLYHRKLQITREHEIIKLDTLLESSPSKPKVDISSITFCDEHPTNEVMYFCSSHKNVYCSMCRATKHAACDNKNINDFLGSNALTKLPDIMSDLTEYAKEFKAQAEMYTTHVAKATQSVATCRDQLENVKQQVLSLFHILETEIDEVEQTNLVKGINIENEKKLCQEICGHLENSLEKFSKVVESSNPRAKLIAMMKADKLQSECLILHSKLAVNKTGLGLQTCYFAMRNHIEKVLSKACVGKIARADLTMDNVPIERPESVASMDSIDDTIPSQTYAPPTIKATTMAAPQKLPVPIKATTMAAPQKLPVPNKATTTATPQKLSWSDIATVTPLAKPLAVTYSAESSYPNYNGEINYPTSKTPVRTEVTAPAKTSYAGKVQVPLAPITPLKKASSVQSLVMPMSGSVLGASAAVTKSTNHVNSSIQEHCQYISELLKLGTLHDENGPTKFNFTTAKYKRSGRIKIRTQSQPKICDITGLAFFPKNFIVACDHANSTLVLLSLSPKLEVVDVCKSKRPWDVVALNETEGIATIPTEHILQFFMIEENKIILKRCMNTKGKCYGIAIYRDCMFLTVHNNPGEAKVEVRQMNGKIMRQLSFDDNKTDAIKLNSPSYISVNKVSNDTCIYLSDGHEKSVVCININKGTCVQVYNQALVRWPKGHVVDNAGNCLITLSFGENLKLVRYQTFSEQGGGKKAKISSFLENVKRPQAVCMNWASKMMFIGIGDSEDILAVQYE